MTAPSSFSVSGLLGGAAGSIDTSALVSQLVQAAGIPQQGLKNQLSVSQAITTAYQTINSRVSTMQTAAQALTDPTAWTATAASSSNPAVVATSTGSAIPGSTTFDVLHLASAQTSTVAAGAGGVVVSVPSNGITITGSDGVAHPITLSSGTAVDVAAAINAAKVGVRAIVVNTDAGQVVQMASSTTGAAASFSVTGFDNPVQTLAAASDAQIGVGTVGAGGYTVSSATNTFTNAIPGITFSVSALATGVTVGVTQDEGSLSTKVKALVDALNSASREITVDSTSGGILQGSSDVRVLQQALLSSVSSGIAGGGTLKTYGIDIDKNGVFSFDATAFATAYAADPAGTQSAVAGSFAKAVDTAASSAIDPADGTITTAINSQTTQQADLNKRITDWNTKLSDLQIRLQGKFAAMETALAKLQSQSTYLTNMMKSMSGSNSSSSSG